MKFNLRHTYWLLLVVSLVSSCLLFIIVASESTKAPDSPKGSDKSVNKNVRINIKKSTSHVNTKENEIKVKVNENMGKSKKKPVLIRENVSTSEEQCVKEMPNMAKDEQNKFFDTGDNGVTHDVFFDATSKNSGVIHNDLPDIPANPPLINLVDSSELLAESDLAENTDDSLKNATSFVLLNKLDGKSSLTSSMSSSQNENSETLHQELVTQLPVVVSEDVATEILEGELVTKDELSPAETKSDTNNTEDGTIPVFSEWAQKQMAEAEQKQKQQEEENGSIAIPKSVRQNNHQVVKLRAKNYASPDCGAKILASNAEAQSTGSVLTASKDEYLLSPCTSRIWFVVELCEPIQAEKIDLANFELFSSSPKNFTVSVSNRFPTRDWSNVGHFTAKDERDVQTFVLHPQLFGKFVRVDIQSHYNSEHYCPVSLFRVYGTSEFEAFETENQPTVIATPDDYSNDVDEDDDGIEYQEGNAVYEPSVDVPLRHKKKTKKGNDENIFKKMGVSVINIVKQAAGVLGKTNDRQNRTVKARQTIECVSLITPFLCHSCNTQLSGSVQQVAACHDDLLSILVTKKYIINSLTQICAIYVNSSSDPNTPFSYKRNYVTTILPLNISIGVCNKLHEIRVSQTECPQTQEPEPQIYEEQKGTEDIQTPPVSQETVEPFSESENISNGERIFHNVEESQPEIIDSGETEVVLDPVPPLVTPPTTVSDTPPEHVIDIPPVESGDVTEENPLQEDSQETSESTTQNKSEESHDTGDLNGNNSWETLETLLESNVGNGNDAVPTATPATNHKQGQPESVFLRLSNRIKSLERNMSLSGQYLEELSRRYKKQVEELQQSFAKTLHHIEEQNRKNTDREQQLYEQNLQMRHDLNEVMEALQNWKTIVMYCGGFIGLQMVILFSLLRNCSRRNNLLTEALETTLAVAKKKKRNKSEMKRRKSMDGNLHISPAIRRRRPSEEALKISGTYEDLLIAGGGDDVKNIGSGSEGADFVEVKVESTTSGKKKKNKDKVRKTSTGSRVSKRSSSGDSNNGHQRNSRDSPAEYDIKNGNVIRYHGNNPIEELPYLEDNDEFIIPTASELSYNEYVPSMSSSQRINGLDSDTSSRSSNTKLDKSRRLSSPAFFKTALTRTSTRKSLPPVVQTSGWEWYRLRKSKAKSESPDVISVGGVSNVMSTSTPADSSGNSDEASTKSKKAGGSFRRILKKVF